MDGTTIPDDPRASRSEETPGGQDLVGENPENNDGGYFGSALNALSSVTDTVTTTASAGWEAAYEKVNNA